LSIYVAVAHWNKLPAKKQVTSITAQSLTLGFQLFFPAAFYLVAIPWFCDWRTKTLYTIYE
jgi:predicted small integral membrane protein